MKRLPTARLYAYGALALPLAMLSLPLYVHLPKFYAEQFGLTLAAQGALLLAARALDALQDPLLGHLADRARARGVDRRAWLLLGTPLLAVASVGLFAPPAFALVHIAAWFFAMLMLVQGALALVQISYQAYGAELATDEHQRTRITAIREGLGLLGVLAGVLLPAWCALTLGPREGMQSFALTVAAALLVTAVVSVHLAPPPLIVHRSASAEPAWRAMMRPLANRRFRHLVAVFALNGIANAIPATLVLFYVDDVIARADLAPLFLCIYFLAGVLAMPLWPWLARRFDSHRAWSLAMLTSIAAFAWAALLGAGDVWPYAAVCLLSGLALGADLALPPALLAAAIDDEAAQGRGYPGGAYFGLWTLATKLSLALAAGLALPALAALGYDATTVAGATGTRALALVYAVLPCVFKAAACTLLLRGEPRARATPHLMSTWP